MILRWRDRLMQGGKAFKAVMGGLLVAVGVAILTGFDKAVETWLNKMSPAWLIDLTTKF